MKHPFLALLARWAVLAFGVFIATKVIPGIQYDSFGTLVAVVALLSLFNAVLKPLLMLFSLPLIVLSLGVGVLFINALLFLLVGELVTGFSVDTFWHAMGGSLIVSLTNVFVSLLFGKPRPPGGGPRPPSARAPKIRPTDVIDI